MSTQLNDKELKKCELNILKYIHDACTKNKISYFVAYGSLIGAIRHNGFIPWDDDIDVCMLREDYERFNRLQHDSRYKIINGNNSKYYYSTFTRIFDSTTRMELHNMIEIENVGVCVDIFPLDNVPDSKNERAVFFDELNMLHASIVNALPFKMYRLLPLFNRIKKLGAKIANPSLFFESTLLRLKEKREKAMLRYGDNTNYVALLFDHSEEALVIPKELLKEYELHKFEDIEVVIPKEYDKILRLYYGDYMQLPPEEQRKSHHHFVAFWL